MDKQLKEIEDELKHFKKTGIPRCIKCKKNFINDTDPITKKASKHLWKPTCNCMKNKNLRLSIG